MRAYASVQTKRSRSVAWRHETKLPLAKQRRWPERAADIGRLPSDGRLERGGYVDDGGCLHGEANDDQHAEKLSEEAPGPPPPEPHSGHGLEVPPATPRASGVLGRWDKHIRQVGTVGTLPPVFTTGFTRRGAGACWSLGPQVRRMASGARCSKTGTWRRGSRSIAGSIITGRSHPAQAPSTRQSKKAAKDETSAEIKRVQSRICRCRQSRRGGGGLGAVVGTSRRRPWPVSVCAALGRRCVWTRVSVTRP